MEATTGPPSHSHIYHPAWAINPYMSSLLFLESPCSTQGQLWIPPLQSTQRFPDSTIFLFLPSTIFFLKVYFHQHKNIPWSLPSSKPNKNKTIHLLAPCSSSILSHSVTLLLTLLLEGIICHPHCHLLTSHPKWASIPSTPPKLPGSVRPVSSKGHPSIPVPVVLST